jgi:hypothetical protein
MFHNKDKIEYLEYEVKTIFFTNLFLTFSRFSYNDMKPMVIVFDDIFNNYN